LGLLGLTALVLIVVPPLLVPDGYVGASERARLLAEAGLRSTALQVIAGLVVVLGIVYTAGQFRISRETHYTDRYTKAIDQIGHDKPAVRLGGIFALQRLAANSGTDRPMIVDVLRGFLRAEAARPEQALLPPTSSERRQMNPDIQAALTVLVALHGADA
jgi:hypothetical protein